MYKKFCLILLIYFSYTLSCAVIHLWRSPSRQFARARTIDKYDVTMPAPHVRVTSQINCGDVTMLIKKRPSSATMAKSAKLCAQDIKYHARNKIIHSSPWITIFGSLVMWFASDFHSRLLHSWKLLANRLTRDPKSLFTVTRALFFITYIKQNCGFRRAKLSND